MPRGRPRKDAGKVLIRSAELIGWALGGIEREILETQKRLVALTAQARHLRARVAGSRGGVQEPASGSEAAAPKRRRRRKMSAESRKRISEMMKKRWAERKKKA